MDKEWSGKALADFLDWKDNSPDIAERILDIIASIEANPFQGIGKPEPLKHGLTKLWSRRITEGNRLVYNVQTIQEKGETKQVLFIHSCKGHYKTKKSTRK